MVSALGAAVSHRRGLAVFALGALIGGIPLALDIRGTLGVALPVVVSRVLALLIALVFAGALSARLGSRSVLPIVLVAVYGAVALTSESLILLAGASVGLAVLSAALALMITVPAPTFERAVSETVLAGVVATFGGLGVLGFDAGLKEGRLSAVVLLGTVLGAFVMVFRLGAGFHGLGRRGYVVAGGALALLLISLVYGAAFSRWGSHDIVSGMDSARDWIRDHLYAVPHPIEAILGVPALCWGTFMRARRRQGWWVCAFGAAFTAPSATRFVVTGVPLTNALVSIAYTLVIGFVLAWVLIRVDQRLTGNRGRRARRVEEAVAVRPEPDRYSPLR